MNVAAVLKKTYSEWSAHEAPRMGASLAYYSILSIAPLIIVVIAILGLALGQEAARGEISNQVSSMIGDQGAKAVESMISSAKKPSSGVLATVIGLITLLFGASGVFTELRQSLNKIWDVKQKETSGVWAFIHEKFLSFGMVLGIGFLLLVSLVLSAGLSLLGKFFGGILPIPAFVLQGVNLLVSFVVITLLFAAIYRFLPDEHIPWNDVWIGAAATALLFTLGKFLIGLYLGKASVGSAYGAAGSLIVMLVWIYYSAQIFFFGAEFTHVYATEHGSRKAEAKAPETKAVEQKQTSTVTATPAAVPVARPVAPRRSYIPPPAETAKASALSVAYVAALAGMGWWQRSHSKSK